MVSHNASPPPREPRSLSPETLAVLSTTIAERWRAVGDADEALGELIRRVGAEAHDRDLQPEELVIAIKHVEESVLALAAPRRHRRWHRRENSRACSNSSASTRSSKRSMTS